MRAVVMKMAGVLSSAGRGFEKTWRGLLVAALAFAYIPATGLVYATAGDNTMFILDASTGEDLFRDSRNGSAAYGAVLPYGEDVCLVMDALRGYRALYRGGYEPTQDGVTAWRGTRMLWHRDVPPDAELQVAGSRIYAVTKTRSRILVREIKVPKQR